MIKAKEVIAATRYAEFPDTLLTLELNRAFSIRDKRSVPQSLRAGARVMISRIQNPQLKATLESMSKSPFLEMHIAQIRDCIKRMEFALVRAQKKLSEFQ